MGSLNFFEELKEKLGGVVNDGVVYGSLMKGCFMKGMETKAMECYNEAVGENSSVKMSAVAYNLVLDTLFQNGKFDEALKLFDRMISKHNPPKQLAVNLGSLNVMADGYCGGGRFKDAIEVFRKMGEYKCSPDTLSFNNLIDQLCKNGMLAEAEELHGEMGVKGMNPDEYAYGLLMDACFKENRIDDGAAYFRKMIDLGLRPNLSVYNRLVDQLVQVRKIDEAKSFFDIMVKKLKMDDASYKSVVKALSDVGKLDEILGTVNGMLDNDGIEFSEDLQEFVKEELRKWGRGEELVKSMEEKERLKAETKAKEVEAAEAAKKSARAAISSLIPSKFGDQEGVRETADNANAVEAQAGKEANLEEATVVESASADANKAEELIDGEMLVQLSK